MTCALLRQETDHSVTTHTPTQVTTAAVDRGQSTLLSLNCVSVYASKVFVSVFSGLFPAAFAWKFSSFHKFSPRFTLIFENSSNFFEVYFFGLSLRLVVCKTWFYLFYLFFDDFLAAMSSCEFCEKLKK